MGDWVKMREPWFLGLCGVEKLQWGILAAVVGHRSSVIGHRSSVIGHWAWGKVQWAGCGGDLP